MDYEKKYKDALETARKINSGEGVAAPPDWTICEVIFPELKESKDEKIRKGITSILEHYKESGEVVCPYPFVSIDEALAWLDKQGEQKPNPYTGTSFEYNGHTWGMCARDNGVEILFDGELKAFISSEKSFIYPIHPQPSLIPKPEQETIDKEKVEPKFKVGNWVISTLLEIKYPHLITDIQDGYYIFGEDDDYAHIASNDDVLKLWTIEDAKNGDVLACENGWTCIFKCLNDNLFNSHCFMDAEGWFCEDGGQAHTLDNRICGEIHPATKEQRDLLFQKMKEAGWEFDFEKKELKKISQRIISAEAKEAMYSNSAWSEEDESYLNTTIAYLKDAKEFKKTAENCITLLKSLKERL